MKESPPSPNKHWLLWFGIPVLSALSSFGAAWSALALQKQELSLKMAAQQKMSADKDEDQELALEVQRHAEQAHRDKIELELVRTLSDKLISDNAEERCRAVELVGALEGDLATRLLRLQKISESCVKERTIAEAALAERQEEGDSVNESPDVSSSNGSVSLQVKTLSAKPRQWRVNFAYVPAEGMAKKIKKVEFYVYGGRPPVKPGRWDGESYSMSYVATQCKPDLPVLVYTDGGVERIDFNMCQNQSWKDASQTN